MERFELMKELLKSETTPLYGKEKVIGLLEEWQGKSYIEKLCEILEVTPNEPFRVEGLPGRYMISTESCGMVDYGRGWKFDEGILENILLGARKIVVEPRKGETVYVPYFYYSHPVTSIMWDGSEACRNAQKNVGVYRTEEEALKKAKELGWVENE